MKSEPAIHALLVEDDVRLGRLVVEYLEKNGVAVSHVTDGTTALSEARRARFDVVLLDIMLPGLDGLEVTKRLRSQSGVPIIMLTARGDEADRILGLELGADDYLAKPYSPRELLARIHAVLRRTRGAPTLEETVRVGGLLLEPPRLTATFAGKPLDLTAYEFSLLRVLAERAGRVLAREQLMELARGSAEEALDRSIDVHVSRLRQKLAAVAGEARAKAIIKTVRGAGYVLTDATPASDDSE